MSQKYHHGALRQALIDAAEVVLEREGLEALTLRAVAREAGVSHAAPTHHFGDLTGLLSELAAVGFTRFHDQMADATCKTKSSDRYFLLLGQAYVAFARDYPELFKLMFRSERLDWENESLFGAGRAAFALLDGPQKDSSDESIVSFDSIVAATTRWSIMHGLATLLVDGRLEPTAHRASDGDLAKLIERVLKNGLSKS